MLQVRKLRYQFLCACAVVALMLSAVPRAQAVDELTAVSTSKDHFADEQRLEPFARSRSDAAEQAGQVPGAAFVLLEALRWRGQTAQQLGLPSKLWCADFMNFVFARNGSRGTNSRSARSYLKYGELLDSPRVGAIAIFARGGANSGHVGVVRGTDGEGNPIIVSGNHGHAVRQAVYPKARVLGYVMPPDYVLKEMARHARAAAMTNIR
jgi:uncharacterized protein (TIGR02594 family)